MAYVTVRCKRGHSFRAYVASRYSKVECPECKRRNDDDSFTSSVTESISVSDFWTASSDSSYSSSCSDSSSSSDSGSCGD